jgi:integrase
MEVIMASLYKKNNIYYLSVKFNGKRKAKSLHTGKFSAAKQLQPLVEFELLKELHGLNKKQKQITFKDLIPLYLKADQDWSGKTREHANYILKSWIKTNGKLPENKASADTFKRRINAVLNWGKRHDYKCIDLVKYKLSSPPARIRVFTPEEITIIIHDFEPAYFRRFCEFAYNTGGRSGEIRNVKVGNLKDGNLFVRGKTGYRTIVLNQRARQLLEWFDYTKDYVSHRFKRECRKHGIKDARFHDLRRTFGYRLILNGMPIYHVSKLLGHSSVTTTEKHYAPLMATEIDEFAL